MVAGTMNVIYNLKGKLGTANKLIGKMSLKPVKPVH